MADLKGELVRLTSALIRKKSVNGDESNTNKVVEDYFKKNKIKYKTFSKVKGRSNVFGYIGKGKPSLVFIAHADTVPEGKGWKTNAFKPVIKNGRIYGRGSSDNKGQIACLMVLAKLFKNVKLKGQLILASVADEESGSHDGVLWLLKKGYLKPTYTIIPDIGGSMETISVAEKGVVRLKITSYGKQAHGSRPRLGVNAVYMMNKLVALIEKYKLKHKKHKLLSAPTINLGSIKGGSVPNIVPAECEIVLDIRYLPSQTAGGIVKEIKSLIKKAKGKFKVEMLLDSRPFELSPSGPLVKSIEKNAKKILKKKPKIVGQSGGTVARYLVRKKMSAIGFAPGKSSLFHVANEYIDIKELVDFTKISALVVEDLLK